MNNQHLRLHWAPTFKEFTAAQRWSDDIRARDPRHPRMYGRVYQLPYDDGAGDDWLWFVGEKESIASGTAATSLDACLAAEAAWFGYRRAIVEVQARLLRQQRAVAFRRPAAIGLGL